MRRILAGAVVAVVMLAGGIAIAAIVTSPGPATAQEETESEALEESKAENKETIVLSGAEGFIDEALEELVESDVITQSQAEAVKEALLSKLEDLGGTLRERFESFRFGDSEDFRFELPGDGGFFRFRHFPDFDDLPDGFPELGDLPDLPGLFFGPGHFSSPLQAAADSIEIPLRELLEAMADGQAIVELAEAEGADPEDVIDAMVESVAGGLDQAVEKGVLEEELAAETRAGIREAMTALAEGESGLFGFGPRGPRFRFDFDFDHHSEQTSASADTGIGPSPS